MTICSSLVDRQTAVSTVVQQPVYEATVLPCDETWLFAVTNGEVRKEKRLNFRDARNLMYWILLEEEF